MISEGRKRNFKDFTLCSVTGIWTILCFRIGHVLHNEKPYKNGQGFVGPFDEVVRTIADKAINKEFK